MGHTIERTDMQWDQMDHRRMSTGGPLSVRFRSSTIIVVSTSAMKDMMISTMPSDYWVCQNLLEPFDKLLILLGTPSFISAIYDP